MDVLPGQACIDDHIPDVVILLQGGTVMTEQTSSVAQATIVLGTSLACQNRQRQSLQPEMDIYTHIHPSSTPPSSRPQRPASKWDVTSHRRECERVDVEVDRRRKRSRVLLSHQQFAQSYVNWRPDWEKKGKLCASIEDKEWGKTRGTENLCWFICSQPWGDDGIILAFVRTYSTEHRGLFFT